MPSSQAQTFLHMSLASSSNTTSESRTRRILTLPKQTQQHLLLRRCAARKGAPGQSHPPWTSQISMSMFNVYGLQSKESISTHSSAALDTQQEWRINLQTCTKPSYCPSINLHRIAPEMSKWCQSPFNQVLLAHRALMLQPDPRLILTQQLGQRLILLSELHQQQSSHAPIQRRPQAQHVLTLLRHHH